MLICMCVCGVHVYRCVHPSTHRREWCQVSCSLIPHLSLWERASHCIFWLRASKCQVSSTPPPPCAEVKEPLATPGLCVTIVFTKQELLTTKSPPQSVNNLCNSTQQLKTENQIYNAVDYNIWIWYMLRNGSRKILKSVFCSPTIVYLRTENFNITLMCMCLCIDSCIWVPVLAKARSVRYGSGDAGNCESLLFVMGDGNRAGSPAKAEHINCWTVSPAPKAGSFSIC